MEIPKRMRMALSHASTEQASVRVMCTSFALSISLRATLVLSTVVQHLKMHGPTFSAWRIKVYFSHLNHRILFSASHFHLFLFLCIDGNPAYAQSCYESSMNTTALPWSTVAACYATEANDVQNAAASATPKHDYVPWVLVDHAVLEQQSLLQYSICKAYTGTPPASCRGSLASAPSGACFNDNN